MYQGREVLFLLFQPDDVVGIGLSRAHTSTHLLKIRISDAPDLKIGEKIETDGRCFEVYSQPVKDTHNLVWQTEVEET
ncbi:MAG: hypothetical protein LBU87_05255 [Lactobacillales bacterium]|nr:hypothetical protein [Lactobacillales bacterium]